MIRSAPQRLALPILTALALIVLGPAAVRAQILDAKDEGHAGYFREETIADANKLIERMREDCGKTFIVESFPKPEWTDPQWPVKEPKNSKDKVAAHDPVREVNNMNKAQRDDYFHRWAREQARKHTVNGVYVLLCKSPRAVAVVVEPESDDKVFPEPKRAWLREAFFRPLFGPKDDDLLNEIIPGVWYTVQDLQRNPSQDGYGWSWTPVLSVIGVLLGSCVAIAGLRGVVGLVKSFQPAPDPTKTQVASQTTITVPPPTNATREDSVDY